MAQCFYMPLGGVAAAQACVFWCCSLNAREAPMMVFLHCIAVSCLGAGKGSLCIMRDRIWCLVQEGF